MPSSAHDSDLRALRGRRAFRHAALRAAVPGVTMADLNWLGLLAAVAATMALGFLWYSPKLPTGRAWMRAVRAQDMERCGPTRMAAAMGLMVLGTVLLMFVLAHVLVAFRDAQGLDQDPPERAFDLGAGQGAMAGFWMWLGFVVPVQLNLVAFEQRSWTYFAVSAGYYLVALALSGLLLATVGA